MRLTSFFKKGAKPGFRYIAGVSWPRSGHHLLVRLLEHYFGPDFRYCEFYSPELDCCRSFPCSRRGNPIAFSKNHDFDLKLPRLPNISYLVQYRAFLAAVESNYERHLLAHPLDTKEVFQAFARAQLIGYKGFHDKWVARLVPTRNLVVKYETLIAEPLPTLASAIRFFAPSTALDSDRMTALVQSISGETLEKHRDISTPGQGVKETRRIEAFRHYDAAFFASLEAELPEDARTLSGAKRHATDAAKIDPGGGP